MPGIFQPFIFESARHLYRLLTNRDYRTVSRLESRYQRQPRFTDFRAKLYQWKLEIPDAPSFFSTCREIFVQKIYSFKASSEAPRILDLGANIGLSVLFFKKLYPLAQVTAFEADPHIFAYLKRNVHGNGYSDVQLINKAAWHENTILKFHSEGADGGRWAEAGDSGLIDVEAIDIDEFLQERSFDFIKMDIEGAEEFVVPLCRSHLGNVQHIFIEYHSRVGRKQCLDRILSLLAEAGFRIHLQNVLCSPSPLLEIRSAAGFDLQLNIFGWRE